MQMTVRHTRKVLFLDRDDTIIKDYGYLNDPEKVEILEGLVSALKIFRDEGFEFVVTTNQSGLTRGSVSLSNLKLIHQKISSILSLNGIRILNFYSSPYMHNHKRRKPNPGLTQNAVSDFNIDLKNSVFAGDKWRDLDVAFKVGARSILVNYKPDQIGLFKNNKPDLILNNWSDFPKDFLMSSEVKNNYIQNKKSNFKIKTR